MLLSGLISRVYWMYLNWSSLMNVLELVEFIECIWIGRVIECIWIGRVIECTRIGRVIECIWIGRVVECNWIGKVYWMYLNW